MFVRCFFTDRRLLLNNQSIRHSGSSSDSVQHLDICEKFQNQLTIGLRENQNSSLHVYAKGGFYFVIIMSTMSVIK